jgi:hypothetical protein
MKLYEPIDTARMSSVPTFFKGGVRFQLKIIWNL